MFVVSASQVAGKRKILEALMLEEKKLQQLLEVKVLQGKIRELERIKKVQSMPLMQPMPTVKLAPRPPQTSAPAALWQS